MNHVFPTMGTVASLDVRGADLRPDDIQGLHDVFSDLEGRFSLYRPETELSRIATGSLALTESSSELRSTYAAALDWRRLTDGAFTPHRPDGVVDLDGIVKALAIERAGRLLHEHGLRSWSLNVGGDILVSGSPADGMPWIMGIVDPDDRTTLLCAVELRGARRALATSGTSERGEHIWRRSDVVSDLVQASVVADDIVSADVLATAILAGGSSFLAEATQRWSIDVCAIGRDGSIAMTPGLHDSLVAEAAPVPGG
ncbi:FAD:protein FMN transferase [Glaciihabitans sp. UYNi722]|uniref:FAD:protein FMN transferase n=1 Tax=Glaciihabitans sp. UYNi722 TaxID=3156344 RepID=UPI00339AC192